MQDIAVKSMQHMHLFGDISDFDVDPLVLLKAAKNVPVHARRMPSTHVLLKKVILTPTEVSF